MCAVKFYEDPEEQSLDLGRCINKDVLYCYLYMFPSADKFYEDPEQESLDLVKCINKEVRALAAGGCKHIQIDEPCMVRDPKTALKYGIDHLIKCFEVIGHSL